MVSIRYTMCDRMCDTPREPLRETLTGYCLMAGDCGCPSDGLSDVPVWPTGGMGQWGVLGSTYMASAREEGFGFGLFVVVITMKKKLSGFGRVCCVY